MEMAGGKKRVLLKSVKWTERKVCAREDILFILSHHFLFFFLPWSITLKINSQKIKVLNNICGRP